MRADRPYRTALSHDQAIAELRRGAGAQFDPEVVDALLDLLGVEKPEVPDRARGIKLPVRPSSEPPARRRSRGL
jgi:HD-GYP domain-containing protein (c-di-GMP phosphodiesterase class II)